MVFHHFLTQNCMHPSILITFELFLSISVRFFQDWLLFKNLGILALKIRGFFQKKIFDVKSMFFDEYVHKQIKYGQKTLKHFNFHSKSGVFRFLCSEFWIPGNSREFFPEYPGIPGTGKKLFPGIPSTLPGTQPSRQRQTAAAVAKRIFQREIPKTLHVCP